MMSKLSLKNKLVSIIYPTDCLECGEEGEWLCGACAKRSLKPNLQKCSICSRVADVGICSKCQKSSGIDGIISLLPYSRELSTQLIYHAKYYGHHDALKFVTEASRGRILRLIPEKFEHITPVPTSPNQQKKRGYNPADVIAKTLIDEAWEFIDVFQKTKETPSQTSLTKAKRKKNVKGVFKVKTKQLPENLVIADDVITTGSTLGELARLAKKKGAKNIWAVTICHG